MERQETPGPAELVALVQAIMTNAQNYLDDAEILLAHEKWSRARTFAILGKEEVGKASAILGTLTMPTSLRDQVPTDIRDHNVKLLMFQLTGIISGHVTGGDRSDTSAEEAAIQQIEGLLLAENQAKQRGLYVDYENGHIHQPSDITEEQARRAVAELEDALKVAQPLKNTGYHQFLIEPTSDGKAFMDQLWARMIEAYRQDGRGGFLREIDRLVAEFRGV